MTTPNTQSSAVKSPLWNCQQAAEYLGISKSTFWSKCRSGEVPHIRITKRSYRVRQSDLETFLNSRTQ
jgi:excisionase family DNA binding protein